MRGTKAGPFLGFLLVVTTLLGGPIPRASAQDAYSCIDRLSDDEVRHRLSFIEGRFAAGKRRARTWWYGWSAFALGATAFTWTMYGLQVDDGHDDSDPALISAVGASLLLAQAVALPLVPAFAPQRVARLPEATPAERREKLRRATRYLERSAGREELLRGISAHVGPVVFAIGTGTFLAVRHDEPLPTVQAFLAPPVIGEAKVLTLPWQAYYDWERYRSWACQAPPPTPAGDELAATAPSHEERSLEWSFVPAPGGLGFRLEF